VRVLLCVCERECVCVYRCVRERVRVGVWVRESESANEQEPPRTTKKM
jgi:hypothetical protein